MHPDGTHPFRYVLRHSLYHALSQVGGELRPRIGRDADAASQRAAHVRTDFLCRVNLHRAGDEDARLSVAVQVLIVYAVDGGAAAIPGYA